MRVLLHTWAFTGHFNALVPVGQALRAAGHDVAVAVCPSFAVTVTRAGLPAVPLGADLDPQAALREADVTTVSWRDKASETPEQRRRRRASAPRLLLAARSARAIAPALVRFTRDWRPDVVVYEPMSFAGPLVARHLGVPTVRNLWGPDFTVSLREVADPLVGDLFRRFGQDEAELLGDLTLDPCPAALDVHDDLERRRMRFVPYNGAAVLPGWLRRPPVRPRVCVSWGTSLTSTGVEGGFLAPAATRALAGIDAEIVVAVLDSQRGRFDDPLPANVIHIGPVALDLLLPTCDLLIHQGGAGTTMTGLLHGVPQVAVPSMPEMSFNAVRCAAAGAGAYVWGEDATGAAVRDAALRVLGDPAYGTAAGRLRSEMRAMPSPAETVTTLAKLAAGG